MKKTIKLTESELKTLINETVKRVFKEGKRSPNKINEGGFRRFAKSASQGNGQKKGNLQIAYCKTDKKRSAVTGQEKEFISVCLGHVWKDGAQKLVDAINSAVPKHIMNAALGTGNERVIIRVNIDMKDEIPSVTAKLEDAIKQVGEYSDASVETVCNQIFDAVDSVATSSDIANAQTKSIENWKDMLEKLEDPEIRKRLLKYQTTNDYARAYGHILSAGNVQDVLDQFPTASFVAERSTWLKQFNRTVMPNAQRIVVTKPIQSQPSMADLNAAAVTAGYASFKDAKEQTGDATQVMGEIVNLAKLAQKKTATFIKTVMYDVSQTIPPSDPSKDIWTNSIGLADNITGSLNTHAQSFDDKISGGAAKAAKEANQAEISKAKMAKWQSRRNALMMICKRKNIDVSGLKNLDDQEFIAQATYFYAQTLIPNYGIVRQEDINKVAAMCAATMCYSCDCQVPANISKYIISMKNIPIEYVTVAFTLIHDVLPSVSKSIRAKNVKSVYKNESMRNFKSVITEYAQKTVTPQEFFKMCQEEFGGGELGDEMLEAKAALKEAISKIVKDEINAILK